MLSSVAKVQPHACSLYCLHPWLDAKVEIFFLYNTWHIYSSTTIRGHYQDVLYPCHYWSFKHNWCRNRYLALPVRFGGLGISKPTIAAAIEYSCSNKLTDNLVTLILSQNTTIPPDLYYSQGKLKTEVRAMKHVATAQLKTRLPPPLLRSVQLCSEKGSSSWLSALPISDHGFSLHKGAFQVLCAFDTTGNQLISQVTVSVVKDLLSTML